MPKKKPLPRLPEKTEIRAAHFFRKGIQAYCIVLVAIALIAGIAYLSWLSSKGAAGIYSKMK